MAEGFGIEVEELGMVALIGLLLIPGLLWISKARSTASMIGRTALVGGLIAAAVTIEASMDTSAGAVQEAVEG